MAEAAAGQAQEAPLVRAVEEHLRDGERDRLGVAHRRWTPGPVRLGKRSSAST
jgi:hypothetical protein